MVDEEPGCVGDHLLMAICESGSGAIGTCCVR